MYLSLLHLSHLYLLVLLHLNLLHLSLLHLLVLLHLCHL